MSVQQYQSPDRPQDENNFQSRTYYEYNENGDITFMQSLNKPNGYQSEPQVYDYTYQFEEGKKMGWKLSSPNTQDSGWGTVEWVDSLQLLETSFNASGQKEYEMLTTLDQNFFESVAEFKFLSDGSIVSYIKFSNLMEEGKHIGLVQENMLQSQIDTTFIEPLKIDDHGNPTELKSTHTSDNPGGYMIKTYTYYE